MTTQFPETLEDIPDLPKEFGEDGGHFYRYYDKVAEESDEDLVKNLKAQLDEPLTQAGLFAGVNATFLALTLPRLTADPADDTNALLLQVALGVNGTITSAADLPSASFTPPSRIYLVNVFFSVSLMLALFSSLLAVLGQQWIVYYRKQGGGGPEDQRWERLRRYLGAKRWRLELILNDLRVRSVVPIQTAVITYNTTYGICNPRYNPMARYQQRYDSLIPRRARD
ncbi:hypothetical protein FRC00_004704 [Tulasnella sp. 408]|nr:hypothetical protein FRC00_004704 [Tulasnella sp. 408]